MRLATAAMGTRFELVVAGWAPERFRAAAEAALEALEACHRHFSRFAPDSLVAHLARLPAGTAVALDKDTYGLFEDACAVWRGSGGAFDLTAGGAMGSLLLDQERCTLALERAGVTLDLGAIAKGHALDLAAAILRDAGVTRAFLHGGTSSAVGIGGGWRVALDAAGGTVITLRDAALAVSRTGHATPHPTYDPATRRVVRARRRAVVWGPSARRADAWATAAAVLGARPAHFPGEYQLLLTTGRPSTVNRQPSTVSWRRAAAS